jgi:hypothetical protein
MGEMIPAGKINYDNFKKAVNLQPAWSSNPPIFFKIDF